MKKVKAEKGIAPKAKAEDEGEVMLAPANTWLWDGFLVLSEQRLWNETGPQRISITDMASYFTIIGSYNVGERKLFTACMVEMDKLYVDYVHASKPTKGT